MSLFEYQARDVKTDQITKTTIRADSEAQVGKLLLDQGFVPIEIKEIKQRSPLSDFMSRITMKDKVVFARQLATLINAGLPISQSLRSVQEQTNNKRLKTVIGEIIVSVEGGGSLSDAFSKYPDVFNKLFIALLMAGESSGTLDQALQKIADQQEKDENFIRKIRGALTYPIIVLVVILAVMSFLLFILMPQIKTLYRDMKLELPFLTMVLINVTEFFSNWWWLIFIVLGAGIFYLIKYFKTTAGRVFVDGLKLNFPLIKNLLRKMYMARFMRTGQTLMTSGVPILDAMDICGQAVNNHYVKNNIDNAAVKVKSGKPLSVALKSEEYILTLIPQMIKIGEESGKIGDMMGKAADVYEKEVDEEISNISKMVEPALMIILALMAGIMVGAILLPIYNMVGKGGVR